MEYELTELRRKLARYERVVAPLDLVRAAPGAFIEHEPASNVVCRAKVVARSLPESSAVLKDIESPLLLSRAPWDMANLATIWQRR